MLAGSKTPSPSSLRPRPDPEPVKDEKQTLKVVWRLRPTSSLEQVGHLVQWHQGEEEDHGDDGGLQKPEESVEVVSSRNLAEKLLMEPHVPRLFPHSRFDVQKVSPEEAQRNNEC